MFIIVAFVPIVALLFAIYFFHKSWMMDLNTSTAIRSLLFGANKSFFQSEDVTCFHSTSDLKTSESNQQLEPHYKLSNISKLKCTKLAYLPTENFTYNEADTENKTEKRTVVIIFAWLFAKERHLDKYRSLYLEKGFDVLSVKVYVKDFLIPQSGSQQIAANVIRFIMSNQDRYQSIILHAFSVGAYQLGELFVLLNKDCYKHARIVFEKALKGMIYDSALDVNEAAIGLSKATTTNVILQWGINMLMSVHLKLCYHISTRHYISSSKAVHDNMFRSPTLVLLSKDDEVANYVNQFEVIDQWKKNGINVTTKCWDQSPHVSHFFKHRDEYQSLVEEFLRNTAKVL